MIAIMLLHDALSPLTEREITLAEGETLFRRGDAVRSMFLILSGTVRLVRHMPHGAALTLQVAGPGSVLAEASLFAEHYHCDAMCSAAAQVRVLPRARAEHAVAHDPAIALLWAKHLAAEVQSARFQAEIVSLKTVAERLDAWMILRGDLPAKGQWSRVASEIGVTPEALYRELARRRREGSG